MGKVMVTGKAEKVCSPDLCFVTLEIGGSGKTSDEASRGSSDQCERLLEKLKGLGIGPASIEIGRDSISRTVSYQPEDTGYESVKSLSITLPAGPALINAIRNIIETGFEYVSLGTRYAVSGEEEIRKGLLKEAVSDARSRAGILADSMGLEITGIDTANLSGSGDICDLTKEENIETDGCFFRAADSGRLTDLLTPEKITITAEVKIVWLLGP